MSTIISFLIEHWVSVSAIVAAIGARLFPTEKNYDIFSKILKLLDLIIPNLKKGGGRHVAKVILFFALACGCGNSFAQLNTHTRLIEFTTGVQHAADTAETTGNSGHIWYDFATGRYRANEGGANTFLINSGSGGAFWPLDGTAVMGSTTLERSAGVPAFYFKTIGATNQFNIYDNLGANPTVFGKTGITTANSTFQITGTGATSDIQLNSGRDINFNLGAGGVVKFLDNPAELTVSDLSLGVLNITAPNINLTAGEIGTVINDAGTIKLTNIPIDNTITDLVTIDVSTSGTKKLGIRTDITSGVYTPVVTGSVNVSTASIIASSTTYIRLGDIINVHTALNVTPTSTATDTQVRISLPISTANLLTISGVAVDAGGGNSGSIEADFVNDEANLIFVSNGTTSREWRVTFQYKI